MKSNPFRALSQLDVEAAPPPKSVFCWVGKRVFIASCMLACLTAEMIIIILAVNNEF